MHVPSRTRTARASRCTRSFHLGVLNMSTVLLIEDDLALREVMASYMVRRGHTVVSCGSVADARRSLQQLEANGKRPQSVVADINLGDGNGLDFCLKLAPRMPETQWIVMSGDHELVRQAGHAKDPAAMAEIAVIDKPVPLRLLNRYLLQGAERAALVSAENARRGVGKHLATEHDVAIGRVLGEVVADAADRGHEHHRGGKPLRQDLGVVARA